MIDIIIIFIYLNSISQKKKDLFKRQKNGNIICSFPYQPKVQKETGKKLPNAQGKGKKNEEIMHKGRRFSF